MKNNQFKTLSEKEKKAILLGVIAKRSEGKLSKKQLETIVNQIDVNNQYTIEVLTDAKEFAQKITLVDHNYQHSWAGGESQTMTGKNLLDSTLIFGENGSDCYSQNGNRIKDEDWYIEPDFDITQIHVVEISEHDYSNFNNNNYDDDYYYIYIYIPDKTSYKIDPVVQQIINNFNI